MDKFYSVSSDEDDNIVVKNNDLKRKRWEALTPVVDFSSDLSNSTNNLETSCVSKSNEKFEYDDDLLKELYNKYLPSSSTKQEHTKTCNVEDICPSLVKSTLSNQKSVESEVVCKKKNKQTDNQTKKELVKEQKQKEKVLKQAMRTMQNSTSKEQCIKNITVRIGVNIIEQNYGEAIKLTLKENNIATKNTSDFPNLITWTRKIQTLENMLLKETECSEKHCLLIMSYREFLEHVKQGVLVNVIGEIITTNFEHVTVAVFGIDRPNDNQELAIINVKMVFKCHWEFFKDAKKLATFVYMISKSVAQIPYKLERETKLKTQNIYFNDSNKDTVKVDKNGNGLSRLWRQMLTMFPLARLETAEAITSVYPTPFSLFQAYEDCTQKEEMLQDLPIRRAQGPLTAVRKLGPELSRKVCTFFTATENTML